MAFDKPTIPANCAGLAVDYVHKMGIESLSPDKYENLLDSLILLCETRKISNSLPTGIQQLTFCKCKSCGAIMHLNSEGELYCSQWPWCSCRESAIEVPTGIQQTKDVISPNELLECSCGWMGEEDELVAVNNAPPVCPDCRRDNDFTRYSEEQLRNILLHAFGGF